MQQLSAASGYANKNGISSKREEILVLMTHNIIKVFEKSESKLKSHRPSTDDGNSDFGIFEQRIFNTFLSECR
ncbi:unnamed protein product, partial [Ceratitis capitata]